jgi:hypothetical protein
MVSNYSSQPSGFSQMARMMDTLILDSFSTPYALTKITHRPKVSSTNVLPNNSTAATAATATVRSTFSSNNGGGNKKIPTQGERKRAEF